MTTTRTFCATSTTSSRGVGNYQILDPEEAIELANSLGRRGWLMFNPLLSGIAPDEAWKMLHTVEERVMPFVDDGRRTKG